MTIKGLWQYVQKYAIQCMYLLEQRAFRGTVISMDMMGFSFRLMMRARAKVARDWNVVREPVDQQAINVVFYRIFFQETLALLEEGMTLAWFFESGRHPLKKRVDKERIEKRLKTEQEIIDLRKELNTDVFAAKNQEKITRLRNLESNLQVFPSEIKDVILNLLLGLGFPCFACKEGIEAERVASVFCLQDIASAVYSSDGDCMAHGAPIQIKEVGEPVYTDGFGSRSFVVVNRQDLVELLDVTGEQLTDACICAGCDYNENMRLVGFKRSLDLVRLHGSVLNFPASIKRECLNYENVIKEFGMGEIENLLSPQCIEYYNLTTWKDFPALSMQCPAKISNVLAELHLEHEEERFLCLVNKLPVPSRYVHYEKISVQGMTLTQLNFPENATPYTKPEKKSKYSGKKVVTGRNKQEVDTPAKVSLLLTTFEDSDDEL